MRSSCTDWVRLVIVYRNANELGLKAPLISGHGQANSAFRNAVGNVVVGQPIVGAPVLVWQDCPTLILKRRWQPPSSNRTRSGSGPRPTCSRASRTTVRRWCSRQSARPGVGQHAQIRDWLEGQVKNYVGITGIFNFSPTDHAGLKSDALVMMIATDSGWRLTI